MLQKGLVPIAAVALAFAAACGSEQKPASPASPSASAVSTPTAGGDTATLKVNGPTPKSPTGGQRLTSQDLVLTFDAATAKYVQGASFSYRIQLLSAGGQVLEEQTGTGLSYTMKTVLDSDTGYSWRVRAEMEGRVGPWSTNATFKSMEQPSAYIRGNEMYDPLTTGAPSITMQSAGNVEWFKGQGVKLLNREAWVQWVLQSTLTDGEVSFEATGIRNDSWEWKTKIMSMEDFGKGNTTDNPFRVTVDKRTDWVGQGSLVRFTMRSNGKDAGEPKGFPQAWDKTKIYGWRFKWGGGQADLYVYDGGFGGSEKVHLSTIYKAPYAPQNHLIRLGSPFGRNEKETLPDVVIRNLWVSSNPRPSWANTK